MASMGIEIDPSKAYINGTAAILLQQMMAQVRAEMRADLIAVETRLTAKIDDHINQSDRRFVTIESTTSALEKMADADRLEEARRDGQVSVVTGVVSFIQKNAVWLLPLAALVGAIVTGGLDEIVRHQFP